MTTDREQAELRRGFELVKSTFLKDAKAQHEPKETINAVEAVTFEEVAPSDNLPEAFVLAMRKHEGQAEPKLTYLRLHGSLWRRFMAVMGAREGSVRTLDDLRQLLQEYDKLSPPSEAEKLHRLGRQSLQLAHEAVTLSIDNRDLKGAAAKLKQVQRLEGDAAREWDKLAGQT